MFSPSGHQTGVVIQGSSAGANGGGIRLYNKSQLVIDFDVLLEGNLV